MAVMERWVCNMTNFFEGVQCVYFAKFMPTVSHKGNPIMKMICSAKIHTKKTYIFFFNQNVNMTKLEQGSHYLL